MNTTTSGEIEQPGDQDWFRVELLADKSYKIQVNTADTSQTPLRDPLLAGVYSSADELIDGSSDQDSGTDNNSEITLRINTTGTYFIAAAGEAEGTGHYKVSIEELADPDDYSSDLQTIGDLPVDASTIGRIEVSGDQDWFRTQFTGGSTYQIDLQGSATQKGTLTDPYLTGVFNESGNIITNTSDDNSGTLLNSSLSFTAPEDGTYYLAAAANGNLTGTYKLSINDITIEQVNDDYGQTVASATNITIDQPKTGAIETAGDEDWFGVDLLAGQRYIISQQGSDSNKGSLTDPLIPGIYNSSGERINGTLTDDGGSGKDAEMSFIPTQTGRHYISAAAYQSNIGTYSIEVKKFNDPTESSEAFNITLDYEGDPQYLQTFKDAAAVWESIIREDLPDASLEGVGVVDDVIIDAAVIAIDGPGQTLGYAGPRYVRTESKLPISGQMRFDSDDMDSMIQKGTFDEVILHEMGHVLGLGTLWSYMGLTNDNNSQYYGANAVREWNSLLQSSNTTTSIPLETEGGPGTAGGHWSEAVFGHEMMTGYLSGAEQPLSRITIGSLEDMGYKVNYSPADPFSIADVNWDWSMAQQGSTASQSSMSLGNSEAIRSTGSLTSSESPYGERHALILNISSKPTVLQGQSEPSKLMGQVIESSGTSISMSLEDATDVFVELSGEFEKNDPQNEDEIHGLVTEVNFYQSLDLIKTIQFPGAGKQASDVIDNWSDIQLDEDNFIQLNSHQSHDDVILSGSGDDAIFAMGGNDYLDGENGEDIALYRGAMKDYSLFNLPNSNLVQIIDQQSGRDGTDELRNIESLSFSDQTIAISDLTLDNAQMQTISASFPQDSYRAGSSMTLSLDYSSPNDETTTGLSFKLHYNSQIFQPDLTNGISNRYQAADILEFAIASDSDDLDLDSQTDSYIEITIASISGDLPSGIKIADLTFDVAEAHEIDLITGSNTSTMNFSRSSTAAGYDLVADPLSLNRSTISDSFNLDVDGDGIVNAFGDGLMVIRKLLGSAFDGERLTDKATSSATTRSTQEIHDFIQSGIDSKALDLDQDGQVGAFSDGLMLIRSMLGSAFTGEKLTEKAISPESPYNTQSEPWQSVQANIDALIPD